ncbi:MAG: hypothetical protein PHQ52_08090 [Candidatus Omnitrophica bacterium]|nr:hypothetical protein [Candidatus Omnitrophota bacterium]
MKRYVKPKTTKVVLDQKQAILQVCKSGGIYLRITGSPMTCIGPTTTDPQEVCNTTPKGGAGTYASGNTDFSQRPS